MNETRKRQTRMKSRIAVKKDSSLQNKENVPNDASKKGVEKKVLKPPTGRKTLSSRRDNDSHCQANPVVKRGQVKAAPDFNKLHKKWETKLARGKAVIKRANTKIEPFQLTKEVGEQPRAQLEEFDSDEDLLFVEHEDDVNAKRSLESEVLPETSAWCSCGKSKREQATTPATNTHEFKVPKSIRKTFLSSVKTKEKNVEIKELDLFEFKPDNNALQSILNNDGIRFTPSKRTTGTYFSPSPYTQKRTSIYYTGPRPDRSPSAFEKRLSMLRTSKIMAKMRQPESSFEPSNTLVGVQEIGHRFTTTPLKELQNDCNTIRESIRDETSEEMSPNVEISWADTLKSYSHQETCSPVEEEGHLDSDEEDKEALIAQLEEEVRQTLSSVALSKPADPPTEKQHSVTRSKTDFGIVREVSIPLQQRRDKPSIYRKLFVSPSTDRFQNSKTMVHHDTPLNSGYLYTATSSAVPRNRPCVSFDLVEQEYQTKPNSFRMQSASGGLGRVPIDSSLYSLPKERGYASERMKMPLAKDVTPLVNFECNILQEGDLQSVSKVESLNMGVVKGMSTRLNDLESATSGSYWVSEPAAKESAEHTSLIAAASASLNTKLRGKMFEAESAFQKIQPHSAGKIKSSSVTNFCTPVSEQKLLVPTPLRPAVTAANDYPVSSQFLSRRRQIMREARVKSRDDTQEILLNAEVSLYARNIEYLRKYDHYPRLLNPVAKLFNEGDERHFVPVLV